MDYLTFENYLLNFFYMNFRGWNLELVVVENDHDHPPAYEEGHPGLDHGMG